MSGAGAERDAAAPAGMNARILRLALPTLAALVIEPLFLATDTALVGHLGATPLAALAIASAVLAGVVGVLNFLAFATTPIVGRRFGAGDLPGAVRAGVDGIWIALGIGAALLAVLLPLAPPIVEAFGVRGEVAAGAAQYLAIAAVGVPGMLVTMAATGLLRGLQEVRTPMWISIGGFGANIVLNVVLIYPVGMGLAGSALGTTIAQWGIALASVAAVARRARRAGVGALPGRDGVLGTIRVGGWILLRTLSLRILFLAMPIAAVPHGTGVVAAVQVTSTVLNLLAFALDALAIAGQALISEELGAGRAEAARATARRLLRMAILAGLALGAVVAALAWPIAAVFTADAGLQAIAVPGLYLVAVGIPIGGVVYVLDGVLLGAGDARFLALAGLVNLLVTLPALAWAGLAPLDALWAVVAIQAIWSILSMLARAVPMRLRLRGDRWLGAAR